MQKLIERAHEVTDPRGRFYSTPFVAYAKTSTYTPILRQRKPTTNTRPPPYPRTANVEIPTLMVEST